VVSLTHRLDTEIDVLHPNRDLGNTMSLVAGQYVLYNVIFLLDLTIAMFVAFGGDETHARGSYDLSGDVPH